MKHSRHIGLSTLLLSAVSALSAVCPAHALTYNVTSLADNGGPGQLRAAITAANGSSGSTITFQAGLSGKIILSPTFQALPTITVNTTVKGPGASLIAVDGNGTYRPFHIDAPSSTVTISGLTIQNGMDAGGTGGAGILVSSGSLMLSDSTLAGNIATGSGGAISNYGTANLKNCKFSKNSAYNGGAIYNYTYNGGGGIVTIAGCALSANSATINGGAIYNYNYSGGGARIDLTNSTLSGNAAGTNGGGIYNYTYAGSGSIANLTNCTLSKNTAVYGGGIYDYSYSGGGGVSTLRYCTLSGNAASTSGGGLYNYTYSGSGGRSTITDSILYGDVGGEIFGAAAATYSDIQGGRVGTGNVNVNPMFINASVGNLTLKYNSPVIYAGTAIPGITIDLPGLTRHAPPTMGAYESGSGQGGHNILALQNASTHLVSLWTTNGTTVTSMGTVTGTPQIGWDLVGVADFNGDGTTDLLFQNQTSGELVAWYLNVLVVTGSARFPTPNPGYHVVGIGDFNGDGKADIVFQNASSNAIVVWLMNGVQIISSIPTSSTPVTGYRVVGVGDYNSDGDTDIQFQNGTDLVVWYMHGLTVSNSSHITPSPQAGWNVVAVTSLYGHINPDLIFQRASGGQVVVWELRNANAVDKSGGSLSVTPPASWIVVGAK